MKPDNTLEVVMLDFDGTLVDSLNDLYCIYCDFLQQYGSKGTKKGFAELNGPTINESIGLLIQKHNLPEPSEKLLAVYWSLLHQYYDEIAAPFPEALLFLKQVKAQNIKLALVTSATLTMVCPFLIKHSLDTYFDEIITSEGLLKSKPDPEIYKRALIQTRTNAKHAIAIEDSLKGVESALQAGIYTWQINPKLSKLRAHKDWVELPGWPGVRNFFHECYE